MNVLILGYNGFLGRNFLNFLEINRVKTFKFGRKNSFSDLDKIIKKINIIFHFAGENRTKNKKKFIINNQNLTENLIKYLEKRRVNIPVVYSSTIKINETSDYGRSKKKCEEYLIKSFKKNIEIFDTPSYFKDIHKYHQIIHETDLANNFGLYYKKYKKKLSKPMQDAIVKGNKHSAKEYAEAIDFMKRSYESYEEVFEDYHGVLSPSSPGVAPKSLKSTGSAEFNKVWSYLGTPCISLPLLQGEGKMPLGVQLIGAKYDDHRFLGVANWLEKECNK